MTKSTLDATILSLAHRYDDAAKLKLLKAARKAHPEAAKKDILRAAFRMMIEAAESQNGPADHLRRLVMDNRSGDFEGA